MILQINLHFRVINSSSYKTGNTNTGATGTQYSPPRYPAAVQATGFVTKIYDGTLLLSDPR